MIKMPLSTEITVVKLEKISERLAVMWFSPKLMSRKAPTEEATDRYSRAAQSRGWDRAGSSRAAWPRPCTRAAAVKMTLPMANIT